MCLLSFLVEREGDDLDTISLSTGRGSVSIERIKKTQDCSMLLETERRHVRLQDRPTDCTRIPFVDPNRIDKPKYFLMHAHDFAEPIGHAWTTHFERIVRPTATRCFLVGARRGWLMRYPTKPM